MQILAAVETNSSVFWVITRRKVVQNDVSGLPIDPIFKGQAVQKYTVCMYEQEKQCTYKATLRSVRVTIVAVEKQVTCVPLLSSTKSACTVLCCHLWPVWPCHIFPHYP